LHDLEQVTSSLLSSLDHFFTGQAFADQ
jgi:hypothetical protein